MNNSIGVASVLPFQGDFAMVTGYPGRRFAALPRRSALGCKCVSPLGYQSWTDNVQACWAINTDNTVPRGTACNRLRLHVKILQLVWTPIGKDVVCRTNQSLGLR